MTNSIYVVVLSECDNVNCSLTVYVERSIIEVVQFFLKESALCLFGRIPSREKKKGSKRGSWGNHRVSNSLDEFLSADCSLD